MKHITLITGFEAFNASLYRDAATQAIASRISLNPRQYILPRFIMFYYPYLCQTCDVF